MPAVPRQVGEGTQRRRSAVGEDLNVTVGLLAFALLTAQRRRSAVGEDLNTWTMPANA